VVRRNTEEVQGQGDFALFDELFAEDFVDHTPQPGTTPDKAGVRVLYGRLPGFRLSEAGEGMARTAAAWFAERNLVAHVTVTDETDYVATFVVVETLPATVADATTRT